MLLNWSKSLREDAESTAYKSVKCEEKAAGNETKLENGSFGARCLKNFEATANRSVRNAQTDARLNGGSFGHLKAEIISPKVKMCFFKKNNHCTCTCKKLS